MHAITDRTLMPTTGLAGSQRRVPAGRVGAIFDVVITAGFATPWTAALIIRALGNIHDSLGLAGSDVPEFDTPHLLYVTLFGVVVTMWGVVRVLRPVPLLIATDTVGRAAFALTFIWALTEGHSTVVIAFLVTEIAFLIAQWLGVRKALAPMRPSTSGTTLPQHDTRSLVGIAGA